MLYVIFKPNSMRFRSLGWHVGELPPMACALVTDEDIHKVDSVQADGDELQHILSHFGNLPFAKRRPVQTWYGDDARFIAKNLS